MFPGCLQDFSRMFSGCSDGSYWPGGIWWSFQMKVWTLKIQRNPMIPNYSMIPAAAIRWSPGIRWSPAIRWSPGIRWSIRSMDFDNRKVYGDTSITDGLVFFHFWTWITVSQRFPVHLIEPHVTHKTWFYHNFFSSFPSKMLKIKFWGSNILEPGSNILEPPNVPDW